MAAANSRVGGALHGSSGMIAGPRFLLIGYVAVLSIGVVGFGCRQKSNVPVGDAAENLRTLALAYVQFAAQNRGVGPKNKAALKKFMVEQQLLSDQEAERSFVSLRDNQPYVVRWGVRPMGSQPMGKNPPTPEIIIYEQSGDGDTRHVANGQLSITEVPEEEFSKMVPQGDKQ
jgi:hypothetical protein